MLDRSLQFESDCRAGGDVFDVGRGTAGVLVTADLGGSHVGDGAVGIFVCCATDVFPFAGYGVVGDEVGEGIWGIGKNMNLMNGGGKKGTYCERWTSQQRQRERA